MLLKVYVALKNRYSNSSITDNISVKSKICGEAGWGWGWYVLIAIMVKFIMPNSHTTSQGVIFNSSISIVALLILFVSIILFYFKRRKKYYDELHNSPDFKKWSVSFKSGLFSIIIYICCFTALIYVDRILLR